MQNYLKSGDYFGESALIQNKPRAFSVKAVTETILVSIKQVEFKRMIKTKQSL